MDVYMTADQYIRERVLEGERDAETIAAELTRPRLRNLSARDQLELLRPLVAAYVQNRVRGWQRAIDDMAGREKRSNTEAKATGRAAINDLEAAGASIEGTTAMTSAAHQREAWGPAHMSALQARQARLNETVRVPGVGAVLVKDMTREYFKLKIVHLEGVVAGNRKTINFYQRCIDLMDRYAVETFGQVPVEASLDEE